MLFYAIAIVMLRGTSFVMLPIVTAFVEAEQYGVLNLLSSFTSIAGVVLMFGLGEVVYRFASSVEESAQKRVFTWCFSVSVTGCTIAALSLWLLSDWLVPLFPLPVTTQQFCLIIINLGCASITTVPYAMWRLRGKAKRFCGVVVAHTFLQSALTIWLLHLGLGIDANLISGATASACCAAFLMWHYRDLLSIKSTFTVGQYWQYALSMMLSSSTMFFLQGIEQWIIAAHIGAVALASYFIAAQLGLAVSLSIEPFKMWWFARRHRSLSEPEINNPLFSVLGTELAGVAALFIMAVMPFMLVHLVPEEYLQALQWLPWICLITVLRQQSEFMNFGCFVKWRGSAPVAINCMSAAVMIVLALLWVEFWSLAGVLMAMVIANVVRVVLFLTISQYLLYQPYEFYRVLLMWVWLLLAFLASTHELFGLLVISILCHGISITLHYQHLLTPLIKKVTLRACSFYKQVQSHG